MCVRLHSEETIDIMLRVGLPFRSYIWVTFVLIFRWVTFVLIGQLGLFHLSVLYFDVQLRVNLTSNISFRLK